MSKPKENVTHLAMSKSAICAADILEAWQKNDPEQLNHKLASRAGTDFESSENSLECERRELLDGLTTRIERALASGEDASLYIRLLHHLAAPVSVSSKRN